MCPLQADDRLALLQHGTRLYLVDTSAVSRDLFRQLLLLRWEAPRVMSLAQPLPVQQLMAAALQLEEAAGRWQVRGDEVKGLRQAAVWGGTKP
jgi:DNA mismatch repair protein MLH1